MKNLLIAITLLLLSNCKGDPSTDNDLFKFAKQGKAKKLEQLLISGANPNEVSKQKKISLLHYAAKSGDTATISLLLKYGANLNAQDSMGETPLFYASKSFHNNGIAIRFLLKKGADHTVTNHNGKTLWCKIWSTSKKFISRQEQKTIHALLEAGTNIPTTTKHTLLHLAAAHIESSKVVGDIIKNYDVDVNATDNNGWTALHFATLNNNHKVIVALLQAGAEVNAQTTKTVEKAYQKGHTTMYHYQYPEGATPYDIFKSVSIKSSKNQPSVKKILEEYGGELKLQKRKIGRQYLKLTYTCP